MDDSELLRQKGLRKTSLRIKMLSCFRESKRALSYADLEQKFGSSTDKSTLYRNLAVFEENGIIHRIKDQSRSAKFAFGPLIHPGHRHAHFICDQCNSTYCIEWSTVPENELPAGFKAESVEATVTGICGDCNHS